MSEIVGMLANPMEVIGLAHSLLFPFFPRRAPLLSRQAFSALTRKGSNPKRPSARRIERSQLRSIPPPL